MTVVMMMNDGDEMMKVESVRCEHAEFSCIKIEL